MEGKRSFGLLDRSMSRSSVFVRDQALWEVFIIRHSVDVDIDPLYTPCMDCDVAGDRGRLDSVSLARRGSCSNDGD
jgi:hypothetical protein